MLPWNEQLAIIIKDFQIIRKTYLGNVHISLDSQANY